MLKYGDYEVDETKFPAHVTAKLLQRTVSHILGNETAAAVGSKIKRAIAGEKGDVSKVTPDQMAGWREANATQVTEWEDAHRAAKIQSLYDGTVSVRSERAPSRDPVEAAMLAIAKAEVIAVLKQNGLKFPKSEDTIVLAGKEVDGDTLIERRLERHGDRIRKLAERKVAEDRRLREGIAKGSAEGAGAAEELL